MKELILLGIIFLVPAIFIIIRNFLWDLSFWQKKNYSVERFSLNILWDLDKDSFSHTIISLKFISLVFIMIGFQSYIAGMMGIWAILILWSFEALKRLALTFSTREPKVDLLKPRNLISFLLFLCLPLFIFLSITLPFLSTGTPTDSTFTNIERELQTIPTVYIYLILLSASFLLLDLLTSLITSFIQISINLITIVRRELKFIIYRGKLNGLRSENHIVLYAGSNFHELKGIVQSAKEDCVFIELNTPHQAAEYIIDHSIRNYIIVISTQIKNFREDFKFLEPEIIVLDSEEIDPYEFAEITPLKTSLIINTDFIKDLSSVKISDFESVHMGKQYFFSPSKSNTAEASLNFIKKYTQDGKEFKIDFKINKLNARISLQTQNPRYVEALLPSLLILDIVETKPLTFLPKIESNLKDVDYLFIEGDNSTRIINFTDRELNYIDLRKNILLASEYKGDKKLILLTDGVNRKRIPNQFFRDILGKVDVVITNDPVFLRELKKYSLKSFYADNFKNFSYLARKHSSEGDILLVEGHYREPLIKILKAN